MPITKNDTKEIHREIGYGSDKIHLILQFPLEQYPADQFLPVPSPSFPKDPLRQEIRSILSRELSGKVLP